MTIRNIISSFFVLFILTKCNTKNDIKRFKEIPLPNVEAKPKNPLIGEWKYNNSIWYASNLTLHDNGSFTFHDQGCYGQRFSQGQWINVAGLIILTSFDSFRKRQNSDRHSILNATSKQENKRADIGKDEVYFTDFESVSEPIFPNSNDTIRIYLDKIQLQLKDDTLYCVGLDKLPEQAKFYKAKNNR